MNCPICGHSLPPLLAVLAETSSGVQCPRCWMPVRSFSRGSSYDFSKALQARVLGLSRTSPADAQVRRLLFIHKWLLVL
jgi:hypothetical protein